MQKPTAKPYVFALLMLSGLIGLLAACQRADRDRVPLARVGNHYLYLDEVKHVIPEGALASDSAFAIRSFVNNWIRQQVMLKHAEENLRDRKPAFEQQLRDYYNALLIYTFEEEYVRQNIDTVVTKEQIRTYYQENIDDFVLKENIVKVLYVRLFRNDAALAQIRRLMQSDRRADRMRLAELCRQHAVNYFLDDEVWLFFNDLLKEIPIVTYNQEAYLNHNRFVEIQDSSFHYLIRFVDFRITDNHSPVSLEEDRIRSTIINKRKAETIRRMSEELYERAANKNLFETYF